MCPAYLCDLLETPLKTNYPLRNQDEMFIQPIHARTELYKNSFLPATIERWNSLSTSIKNKPFHQFKKLINNKTELPTYYYIGKRSFQIIHAKMRMNCSDLNYHLFKRFLKDTPDCDCGNAPETPYHFLLVCPKYNLCRKKHISPLSKITKINITILLFV